jgi:hypothetical protein
LVNFSNNAPEDSGFSIIVREAAVSLVRHSLLTYNVRMIDEKFIFVGVALSFAGGMSYLIDTVKGKARPNRVSWFLWAIAPLIAFFAELNQGVGLQSLLTFIAGFNPLLIFCASFINRKSSWKLTRLDAWCGTLAVLGIICWRITGSSNVAILFSILADGLAGIPTIVKSHRDPGSENYQAFLFGVSMRLLPCLP